MTEGDQSTRGGGGAGRGADDYKLGLEVLKRLADQELARADAARARARQAFAFAAGFFAVVQTVTFGSFVSSRASRAHHVSTLINHTTIAAVGLAACAVALIFADLFLPTRDLSPEQVWDALNDNDLPEATLEEHFAHRYAMIVAARRNTNRTRSRLVLATQVIALCAIGLSILELLTGLHAGA